MKAIEVAKKNGMKTVILTGGTGGKLAAMADYTFHRADKAYSPNPGDPHHARAYHLPDGGRGTLRQFPLILEPQPFRRKGAKNSGFI